MATLGQRLLERMEQVEQAVTDLQLGSTETPGTTTTQSQIRQMRQELQNEIGTLRDQIGEMGNGNGTGLGERRRFALNPKECVPNMLGQDYKQAWRTWSYRARDSLAQVDHTLREKLELIESKTTELTPEFLESMAITPHTDAEIRRFLIHKLEGDPAEVIRTKASEGKGGLEQYRCLAQLCDPAAAGRNLSDSKLLYHPSPASSVQTLLARIAEWKLLELRCKARSGEIIPPTLRTLSLLEMCPSALREKLYDQPSVANGTISFDDLENLITTAVHNNEVRLFGGALLKEKLKLRNPFSPSGLKVRMRALVTFQKLDLP